MSASLKELGSLLAFQSRLPMIACLLFGDAKQKGHAAGSHPHKVVGAPCNGADQAGFNSWQLFFSRSP